MIWTYEVSSEQQWCGAWGCKSPQQNISNYLIITPLTLYLLCQSVTIKTHLHFHLVKKRTNTAITERPQAFFTKETEKDWQMSGPSLVNVSWWNNLHLNCKKKNLFRNNRVNDRYVKFKWYLMVQSKIPNLAICDCVSSENRLEVAFYLNNSISYRIQLKTLSWKHYCNLKSNVIKVCYWICNVHHANSMNFYVAESRKTSYLSYCCIQNRNKVFN